MADPATLDGVPVLTAPPPPADERAVSAAGATVTMPWLFRRVFLVNVAGPPGSAVLLGLSPATVSAPILAAGVPLWVPVPEGDRG